MTITFSREQVNLKIKEVFNPFNSFNIKMKNLQGGTSLKLKEAYYPLSRFNIPIQDLVGNIIHGDWRATLGVSSQNTLNRTIVRDFGVNLGMHIPLTKDITKEMVLNLGVKAHRLANAGQVIGDIRFHDKVLTESNYDTVLTPYGYGAWRQLIAGDYTFSKALCRYSMRASLNADRPNTRQYLHKMDVPDIIDTGVATLTKDNQPLFVKFSEDESRKFHIVPEVNVSLKSYSGTNSTPIIIPYDISREGFYVTMKADGASIDGSISWSARGY